MDKKLTLGTDKVLAGVCSGIADYLEVDVAFVRIITAVLILGSFFTGLFLYWICWLSMAKPKKVS
jgi:phage shock protein PspC (stress-responsive transcriptional regulator)